MSLLPGRAAAVFLITSSFVQAQQAGTLEEVHVIGMSPFALGRLSSEVPHHIQRFDAQDIATSQRYSIAQFLDKRAAGVALSDAQNNPLQPDLRFRGYTASPLLGSSPGVVVYLNGVRVNESFGDTVNWDLLPESIVHDMAIIAGPNPVFGQNALGGAIVMQGKNGFNSEGGTLEAGTGSFGARSLMFERGANSDGWGSYINIEGYKEEGWRDFSPTRSRNAYFALSRHAQRSHWDLYLHKSLSELKGNGAVPLGLLEEDREAVFTHPDLTENDMSMANLVFQHWFGGDSRLTANVFFRRIRSDSFNGDGSEKEECDAPNEGFLCEEEEEGGELAEDQYGNPVSSEFNAINNISDRDQKTWGASLSVATRVNWGEVAHHWILGADYLSGTTDFYSEVEYARLRENRSTTRSGLFDAEGYTALESGVDMAALYLSDTVVLSDRLNLQASLRYNYVKVSGEDKSGERPELTASHRYRQLNGGLGLNWSLSDKVGAYAGVYQSSRAPTPVELACSHAEAPCNLPNTFLADPPLDDVVARSIELGLRAQLGRHWQGELGVFRTINHDDIHFQTTGGVSSNQGFFTNIGDTLHQGLELLIRGSFDKLAVSASYTYLDASYRDDFIAFSPNAPAADDGALAVAAGSQIPAIPRHNAKFAVDYNWTPKWQSGVELSASSGVYLRGDEANVDEPTQGYVLANGYIRYQPSSAWQLSLQANNVFDIEYQRFGLYGEPDEVLEDLDNDSPRFLSPAPPRTVMVVLSYRW